MEKVMAINGFEELKENELMETEGGIPIPIVIAVVAGVALTLTGCGGPTDSGSTEDTKPTTEEQGDCFFHNRMECYKSDSCTIGIGDCPYH